MSSLRSQRNSSKTAMSVEKIHQEGKDTCPTFGMKQVDKDQIVTVK